MKVFVDEDTGAGLGRALKAVRVQASYVGGDQPIKPGTRDEAWIPWAGREGSLVFSRNTAILEAEAQRALIVVCGIGIVFLPQPLSAFELLRLVLKKWEWLELVDGTLQRPFAYYVSASGRTRSLPIKPVPESILAEARSMVPLA